MKKHILNLILCLTLVFTLCATARAATLDTTNIRIEEGMVTIGSQENAVLAALDQEGKTAKIAIPYNYADGNYYVVKDGAEVVTSAAEKVDGFLRFPVPGAGEYVIKAGNPPTLDDQLSNQTGEDDLVIALPEDSLNSSYSEVKDGTVIAANGTIKGTGEPQSLTAGGTLVIQNLNGSEEIELSAGDTITFDTDGKATVTVAENENADGKTVGYGSFCLSGVNAQGEPYTKTYFLVKADGEGPEESVTIKPDGTVEFNGVLDPVDGKAAHPVYRIDFEDEDDSYQQGNSETLVAKCNGLFDHFVTITLTRQDSGEAEVLVSRADGEVVKHVTGVHVEKGSTRLTLEDSYLSTLPVGEHTLTFTYDDGVSQNDTLQITERAYVISVSQEEQASGGICTVDKTSALKGTQITVTLKPNTGYTVGGVAVKNAAGEQVAAEPKEEGSHQYTFTMPGSDVTVTPQWTPNRYTITFDTDGGSEIAAITKDYGAAVTKPADPVREGYTFAGWDKEIPATIPAENVVVKAKWTINRYTITTDPLAANQSGYSFTAEPTEVEYLGESVLTLKLKPEYETDGENFHIYHNEVDVTDKLTADKKLTLSDLKENAVVKIVGIADKTAPTVTITIEPNGMSTFLRTITFGAVKEKQSVTVTAADAGSGVNEDSFCYALADHALTEAEVKTLTWKKYSGAFELDTEGTYVAYAKVADNAGNTTITNSEGIILDRTAPVITGVENGKTYYGDQTFTITDNVSVAVMLDGKTVAVTDKQIQVPANNTQRTIVITDAVGNVTEYKINVYKLYDVTFVADGKTIDTQQVGYGCDATMPAVPVKPGYDDKRPVWSLDGKKEADGKNIIADTTFTAVYYKNAPGVFENTTYSGGNAAGVDLDNSINELMAAIPLTEEELNWVELGEDVRIWLKAKENSGAVSAADKALVTNALSGDTVGMYLDLELYKQVGSNAPVPVKALKNKITVTLNVPRSMINTNFNMKRAYYVIRIHDGEATVITPDYNVLTRTLSFETDRFSTYAISYLDTAKPISSIPNTGDNSHIGMWIGILSFSAIALVGCLALSKKKAGSKKK